jgi:hypothetical protein
MGIAGIALLVYLLVHKRRDVSRLYVGLVLTAFVLTAAGGAALLVYTWHDYTTLTNALRSNRYRVIEGIVRDFVAEGPDGHPRERFTVGGTSFQYSSSDITSAFHQTVARGGPVRLGMWVRIAAVDGAIARMEIAR